MTERRILVGDARERSGRGWIGVELNPDYAEMATARTAQQGIGL